ncbi:MAG: M24 family metallopeptidase, partial [Cyanobacteria bacterium]|nr:M24 family metallopeptidase [Cyanobacteriota bacterium]
AEIHEVASRTLRHGLVKLGILPAEMMKKNHAKKAVAKAKEKNKLDELLYLGRFYMHGTGHWLGLDVHDVAGQEGSKSIELKPGMVFTIEPGLYFDKDDKLVPKKYRGIGIRIEDDVVITEDGCEILTSDVPKSVEEIEQLMKR